MRLYDNQPSGTVADLRDLRKNAPDPERRLLQALREGLPHVKWRHQVPIGPYRADIVCMSEHLVIEVDGDTHAHAQGRDVNRTRFIEREGFRVVRVANGDVTQDIDGIVRQISLSLREREGAAKRRKGEGDRP